MRRSLASRSEGSNSIRFLYISQCTRNVAGLTNRFAVIGETACPLLHTRSFFRSPRQPDRATLLQPQWGFHARDAVRNCLRGWFECCRASRREACARDVAKQDKQRKYIGVANHGSSFDDDGFYYFLSFHLSRRFFCDLQRVGTIDCPPSRPRAPFPSRRRVADR